MKLPPFFRYAAAALVAACATLVARAAERPNVLFVIADDLGWGDLGCYGQQKIRTPRIDALAAGGMRFTRAYSGHNVCAPSRCVLLSGKHPGHAFIRENAQAKSIGLPFDEGQIPVPERTLTLPLTLASLGYVQGGFGKWGLGPVGSTGDPLKQGFTHFFGYNCQAVAHNYYPVSLWNDATPVPLDNPKFAAHQKLPADADPADPTAYAGFTGRDYAPDRIHAEAVKFLEANKVRPFHLYYPTTIPHLALQVPAAALAEYAGKFPEEPYPGGRGYLPHRTPRAAYAAMVTHLDRQVGELLDAVEKLGLREKTLVVFTSDNGPLYDKLGGTDTDFFDSAHGLRGRKGSYYEGGFRVPFIVNWPGRIPPGESDRVIGFEDWVPTLFELTGAPLPAGLDGLSFAPTLRGESQPERPFLYRESPGYGGQQIVRQGTWKLVRTRLNPGPKAKNPPPPKTELFDLAKDPAEATDVAAEHPEIVEALMKIAAREHVKSERFHVRALDE